MTIIEVRPEEDGGLNDEQIMRIMMLVARTGRRISEIRMLDRDPLFPLDQLNPPSEQDAADGAFVAKLRYQQTKIEQAPDTMLVDAEIVAIIREQQQWVDTRLAPRWAPGTTPKYLFLAHKMNRHADKAYVLERVHQGLAKFAQRLDIRDSFGRLVDFNRTHRFRHTKATSLLNAGVPLHVVQRYMGHLPDHDHGVRRDPRRHARSRVPALPQGHRRGPRPADRPARSLRHAGAGQAHRPDPAQRLVPSASSPGLREG
ncbi:tyrosine-type recombinase/integrase [Acrocarpospora catenulata]|uniref:tyrosine-type recombinase/integrase n=1 Tax=Acrocarpospora catenulata TaxID=2836182 RepID=UPI001BD9968F|nr:tyrosine-type recombinase/integrase [Acrocarpospora catenulata]